MNSIPFPASSFQRMFLVYIGGFPSLKNFQHPTGVYFEKFSLAHHAS